jgi:hypothetical protein
MESGYSFAELAVMDIVLGDCNGSAMCCYKMKRKIPPSDCATSTYLPVGAFHGVWWDFGRPISVRNVRMKEQIPEAGEREPTISTRRLAAATNTSHASAHHKLQYQQLYPYHVQSVR